MQQTAVNCSDPHTGITIAQKPVELLAYAAKRIRLDSIIDELSYPVRGRDQKFATIAFRNAQYKAPARKELRRTGPPSPDSLVSSYPQISAAVFIEGEYGSAEAAVLPITLDTAAANGAKRAFGVSECPQPTLFLRDPPGAR